MELFEYKKTIGQEYWQDKNIYIDEKSVVADGVKLGRSVVVINSVVSTGAEIKWNSVVENATVKENSKIMSSQIEDSVIGANSTVGPFARIRNNAIIGENARIGNFVEIKNAILGSGCKVAHLAYIGDASLGRNCNVGCGVVFCNYNGAVKQRTEVGNDVFIGSNVNLIAPVIIGDGAYIAAGSTVNKDVNEDDFVIARARQEIKKNFKNPYKNH